MRRSSFMFLVTVASRRPLWSSSWSLLLRPCPNHKFEDRVRGRVRSSTALFSTLTNHTDPRTIALAYDWRKDPAINPTIIFPTWAVPSVRCQDILACPLVQPALGSALEDLQHVHPRVKLVRSSSESEKVLILRNPNYIPKDNPRNEEMQEMLKKWHVEEGPSYSLKLPYSRWPFAYILSKILPQDAQPPPVAFELVGHLAHLNLRPHHLPHGKLIGEVLCEKFNNIKTVVNKVGDVSGRYRTYQYELLAGDENSTKVELIEHGLRLQLDVAQVYWNSRLSGERLYLLQHFEKGQIIADPFCGVGAQCLLAASRLQCRILANDWNPNAIQFLKDNAKLNNVEVEAQCGDAYDFLVDLGYGDQLPHHVIMNYPHDAQRFLSALRWWPLSEATPTIHLYTFARSEGQRDEVTVAMDAVSHHLLPQGREPGSFRQEQMNSVFNCNMTAREVRDVAPGKLVVCVSFKVTRRLIRHMQGDYV